MAKSTQTLEWCVVRLGDDVNWWVDEISDTVHWDTDGLSIVDPRQLAHLIELIEPLRDYGFDPDIMERAFIPFRIDKDLGKNRIRVTRVKDSILESEEKLFALPDTLDDENSPYADFLDHVMRLRVKMLNDLFDFEQKLTVDEVEDELREDENADFMEGKAIHLYTEVVNVLDYTPAGWESDEDEDTPRKKKVASDDEDTDDIPDVDEGDENEIKGDASLRWDEDDEEGEKDENGEAKKKDGDGEEEKVKDDDETAAKPAAGGRKKAKASKSDDDDEDSDEDDEDGDDEDSEEEEEEDEAPKRKKGRR